MNNTIETALRDASKPAISCNVVCHAPTLGTPRRASPRARPAPHRCDAYYGGESRGAGLERVMEPSGRNRWQPVANRGRRIGGSSPPEDLVKAVKSGAVVEPAQPRSRRFRPSSWRRERGGDGSEEEEGIPCPCRARRLPAAQWKYAVCFMLAGKPRFRTVEGDLDAARGEREVLVAAAEAGALSVSPQLRFATVAGRWLARFEERVAAGERRERTLEAHRYYLGKHLLPTLGR